MIYKKSFNLNGFLTYRRILAKARKEGAFIDLRLSLDHLLFDCIKPDVINQIDKVKGTKDYLINILNGLPC